MYMNESRDEQHEPREADARAQDATPWQSPAYTVVETGLEITAYHLADR